MKKLRNLCIVMIALVGLSFSANAQNGTAPYIGSTHSYSVENHTGNTYEWFVTTDFAGAQSATVDDVSTLDINENIASLSNTTENAIDITWDSPAVGITYFVHVIETITATSCSNHKVMAVTPVNGFNLAIAAVDVDDKELSGDDLQDCAPNVIVTGFTAAQDFTYDYGQNIFYYKITASGIGSNGWSPQLTILPTDLDSDADLTTDTKVTYTAQWATEIGGTYTGNDLTVDGAMNDINVLPAVDNASIWVKVAIDNAEGLVDNLITVTLLDAPDTSEDQFGNDVSTITNDVSTQTVKLRPTVNGITTDI